MGTYDLAPNGTLNPPFGDDDTGYPPPPESALAKCENTIAKTKTVGCGSCTDLNAISTAVVGLVDSNNALPYRDSGR